MSSNLCRTALEQRDPSRQAKLYRARQSSAMRWHEVGYRQGGCFGLNIKEALSNCQHCSAEAASEGGWLPITKYLSKDCGYC